MELEHLSTYQLNNDIKNECEYSFFGCDILFFFKNENIYKNPTTQNLFLKNDCVRHSNIYDLEVATHHLNLLKNHIIKFCNSNNNKMLKL